MAIRRDDRYIADGLGRALSGAQVYWCLQPATTAVNPPSPLATIYTDITGATPETQPIIADGFGHSWAYMDDSVLYTVVIWHPLFGPYPIVLPDQSIGGGGGGGTTVIPVQASTTEGTITGAIPGSVFTLPSVPIAGSLVFNVNGQVLNPGTTLGPTVGYTLSGAVVTLFTALQTGDIANANYLVA